MTCRVDIGIFSELKPNKTTNSKPKSRGWNISACHWEMKYLVWGWVTQHWDGLVL